MSEPAAVLRKKVCMLGSFAVGKTSLVVRFVEDSFSDRYRTTIGVRIMKKTVEAEGRTVSLVLWDLHGDDDFQKVRSTYLRGAAGYLLVADGTRRETVDKARQLADFARDALGDVPFLLLVNKADLTAEWDLADDFESRLPGWSVLRTSAKTGEGVAEAFEHLTTRMLGGRA